MNNFFGRKREIVFEKVESLLNEEECKIVGHPVKKKEEPQNVVDGQPMYNRKGKANIYVDAIYQYDDSDEGKYNFKLEEEIKEYLYTNKIKTKNYFRSGNALIPLYDEETLRKKLGFPVLFKTYRSDIKPYHWQEYELSKLGISLEDKDISLLVLSEYERENGFYYDCRKLLVGVGEKYITKEQYEKDRNFRNLTNKDIERLPKKWFLKEKKLCRLGFLDSKTIFYRIEDDEKDGTGFGKILTKEEINETDSIVDIRDFYEFKNMINEKNKPITTVIFKGLTEDLKGVFDLSGINKPIVKIKRKGNLTFDYLEKSLPLLIKAGDVAAHEIVRVRSGEVRNVDMINKMDRIYYAEKLINTVDPRILKGNYEKEQLVRDIAMFIDQRVPLAYSKYVKGEKSTSPKFGLDCGLKYQFEENNEEIKKPAVKKVEKSDSEKKNIKESTEKRNNNYKTLLDYLNKKGKRLKSEEFKAVLNTMNAMTINYKTKEQAISYGSETFNVTKKFLKEIIKNMGIESTRNLQAKKEFGKMVAIESNVLKKKLSEEK